MFDKSPERKGYIISLDPDPPDDYDSDNKGMVIDESHFRLHVNSLPITFISTVEIVKHVDAKNGTILDLSPHQLADNIFVGNTKH